MSEYQEFTGKTVEEAIRNAREAFGVGGLEDLDFEILTQGSRGVLGMGAEPARIIAAPRSALGGSAPKKEAAAALPASPAPGRAPRDDEPRVSRARAVTTGVTTGAAAASRVTGGPDRGPRRHDRSGSRRSSRAEPRQAPATTEAARGRRGGEQWPLPRREPLAGRRKRRRRLLDAGREDPRAARRADGLSAPASRSARVPPPASPSTAPTTTSRRRSARSSAARASASRRSSTSSTSCCRAAWAPGRGCSWTSRTTADGVSASSWRSPRRAAEHVRETGQMLQLEPMSALERRWVHLALRDVEGIATQSIGEEPTRRVVVLPI